MKDLSKPLSSPSKGDKFPPPLMMTFLRSNYGSRSRGRLKASPVFYLRCKKNVIETTQEPSSPKVTCIGQVRARRSSKSKPKSTPKQGCGSAGNRPCWWLKKAFYWNRISAEPGPGFFRRFFRRWGSYFCSSVDSNRKPEENKNHIGSGRNSTESEISFKSENFGSRVRQNREDFQFLESSSSPPRNALLLTRCRSAPYRASSLAGRFWGSPLAAVEDGESEAKLQNNAVVESRNSHESDELGNSVNANSVAVHPLLLTRCKSEPARTGERLNPDANFWRQRRLAADLSRLLSGSPSTTTGDHSSLCTGDDDLLLH